MCGKMRDSRLCCWVLLLAVGVLLQSHPTCGAETGLIHIKADRGIKIFLDGTLVGLTKDEDKGLVLQEVAEGKHVVRAVKDGFAPQDAEVEVKAGKVMVQELAAFQPKVALVEQRQDGTTPPASGKTAPWQIPVPDEAQRTAALKIVREQFADQYKKRDQLSLRCLSQDLFCNALETEDKPGIRYVLLTEALQQAIGAGDAVAVHTCLKWLEKYYAVEDCNTLCITSMNEVRSRLTPSNSLQSADAFIETALRLRLSHKYAAALEMALHAVSLSNRTQDVLLKARARDLRSDLAKLVPIEKRTLELFGVLSQKPNDPDASLELGRHLCLQMREWSEGLLLLSQSGTTPLALLAKDDLATQEDLPRAKLADRWTEYAAKETDPYLRSSILLRALALYERSLRTLKGIDLTNCTKSVVNLRTLLRLPVASTDAAQIIEASQWPGMVSAYKESFNDWQKRGPGSLKLLDFAVGVSGNWSIRSLAERMALAYPTVEVLCSPETPDQRVVGAIFNWLPEEYLERSTDPVDLVQKICYLIDNIETTHIKMNENGNLRHDAGINCKRGGLPGGVPGFVRPLSVPELLRRIGKKRGPPVPDGPTGTRLVGWLRARGLPQGAVDSCRTQIQSVYGK